ncbi:MAG: hypothetical protein ACRC9V_14690, partial [Aeromonas sp.]
MCQCRMDLILSSRNAEGFFDKVKYKEMCLRYHRSMHMRLDWSTFKRGPGVWVLNAEVLKRESYVLEIKELIVKDRS